MDDTNSTEEPSPDLESCQTDNENDDTNEDSQSAKPLLFYHNNMLKNLFCNDPNQDSTIVVQTQEPEKSKGLSNNNKKKKACSKPPRPPKGPILAPSDMKLIKEISQLVMKKRARIERIKALRKMKEIKPPPSSSSSSSPSKSSISATIITILFFIILILHGLNTKLGSHRMIFQASPEPSMTDANSLISVHIFHDPL